MGILQMAIGGIIASIWFSESSRQSEDLNRFIKATAWAGTLYGILALLQFFGILPTTQASIYTFVRGAPIFRSTGFHPHATEFSIIGIVLFAMTVFYASKVKKQELPVALLQVFLVSCGVVTTLSRVAFVDLILISILLLAFSIGRNVLSRFILISTCLAAILIVAGIAMIGSSSLFLSRVADFDIKRTHGQRVYENYLGVRLAQLFPNGVGLTNIAKVAQPEIDKLVKENNIQWEFTEWRGIHNDLLSSLVLWGWVGLLFYFFLYLYPLLVFYEKRDSLAFIIAFLVTLALIVYAFTNSIFYRESSFFIGFTLYALTTFKIKEPLKVPGLRLCIIIALVLFSAVIPGVRTWMIENRTMYLVYFDNPTMDFHHLVIEGKSRSIPPLSYVFLYVDKPRITISTHGFERSLNLNPQQYKSLINIAPGTYLSSDITFEFSPEDLRLKRTSYLRQTAPWTAMYFPEEDPRFYYSPPFTFEKYDPARDSSYFAGYPTQKLVLVDPTLLWTCWDPTWTWLGLSHEINFCEINKDWSPYGSSVFRNLDKYLGQVIKGFR